MKRNVLLILADAAEAKAVRRSLLDSRDGPFKVEWVSRCSDASNRLRSLQAGQEIAAIVLDLFLPDSQGIVFTAKQEGPCATKMSPGLPSSAGRKIICWRSASTGTR